MWIAQLLKSVNSKKNLISSHTCEKIWCVSSSNQQQFPNEIIVIMTTVVCLEA